MTWRSINTPSQDTHSKFLALLEEGYRWQVKVGDHVAAAFGLPVWVPPLVKRVNPERRQFEDRGDFWIGDRVFGVKSMGFFFTDRQDFRSTNPWIDSVNALERPKLNPFGLGTRLDEAVVFISRQTEAMLFLPFAETRDCWGKETRIFRNLGGLPTFQDEYYYVHKSFLRPMDQFGDWFRSSMPKGITGGPLG